MEKIYFTTIFCYLCLYVCIILSICYIDMPAIQWDEVLQAPPAIDLIKTDTNRNYPCFYEHVVFGRVIPLMNHYYIGAIIYKLHDLLQKNYSKRPIQLMNWGLGNNLYLLSQGNLYTREPFWIYAESPQPDERLRELIRNHQNVFVFNSTDRTLFPSARLAFESALEETGIIIKSEKRLYDRRGVWVYSIIELNDMGTML